MKKKKCKYCSNEYEPQRPLQSVCSPACAYDYALKLKLKKEAKEWKIEKEKIKGKLLNKQHYIKILQILFNSYIRKRDADLPCVSCGTYKAEEFHAGHFAPTTFQYLRFNELNVHKQCSKCNTHLRGNLIAYRIELIKRIGIKEVEKLENDRNKEYRPTIDELQQLIDIYKKKNKDA